MRDLRTLAGLVLVLVGVPVAMIGAARWLPVRAADGQRLSLGSPSASIAMLCAGALVTALGVVVVCLRRRDEVVLVVEAHRLTEVADRIAARLGGAVPVRHRPPSLAVPAVAPTSPAPVSPAPVSPAVRPEPVRVGGGEYVSAAAVSPEAEQGRESRRGTVAALRAQSGSHRAVGSARLPTVGANVRWRGSAEAPYPPALGPAGAHWPPMPVNGPDPEPVPLPTPAATAEPGLEEPRESGVGDGPRRTDAARNGRPARLTARAAVPPGAKAPGATPAVRRNSVGHHRTDGA